MLARGVFGPCGSRAVGGPVAAALGHRPVQSAPAAPGTNGTHTGGRGVGLSLGGLAGMQPISSVRGLPSGHLDPRKGRPLGGRLRQKPVTPRGWGRGDSGMLPVPRAHHSVSPKARARAAAGTEDGFMGARTGISHFNGCVLIFMVASYLWQRRWLSVHREARVAASQ